MEKANREQSCEMTILPKEDKAHYVHEIEDCARRKRCSWEKAIRELGYYDELKNTNIYEEDFNDEQNLINTPGYVEFANFETDNMPSVKLDDRKMAIQGLMSRYNYLNGKKGFTSDSGKMSAAKNYKPKQLKEMNKEIIENISDARRIIDDIFNKLMGGNDVANDNIDEKNSLRSDMYSKYGAGHANSLDREKLVESLYVPEPIKEDSKQK